MPDQTSLLSDWLECLGLANPVIGLAGIQAVYAQTDIRWEQECFAPFRTAHFYFTQSDNPADRKASYRVHAGIAAWPRVERIEALLSLALRSWQNIACIGAANYARLCARAGCDPTLSLQVRERWTRLGYSQDYRTLPVSVFEDRLVCPVCNKHVCTGHANPKIHDECLAFARLVLRPAQRIERARKTVT